MDGVVFVPAYFVAGGFKELVFELDVSCSDTVQQPAWALGVCLWLLQRFLKVTNKRARPVCGWRG